MVRTAPLFRPDAGWLFTLAGLAILVAAALLPAERDLHDLRQQLARIEWRESANLQRMRAYERFRRDLSAGDPSLLRRLAASQLNLMPEGQSPLLMATSIAHTVADWVEASVAVDPFEPQPLPDTLLGRLAAGQGRLWLMAGGAMSVFVGLVMGYGVSQRPSMPEAESLDDVGTLVEPQAPAREEPLAVIHPAEREDADLEPWPPEPLPEEEAFAWPELEPPFEPSPSDAGSTPEGVLLAEDSRADPDGWLREHGSD
ncbi:MAG: hypothetical protein ACO32J_06465 [Phycisphaerales bacterium]